MSKVINKIQEKFSNVPYDYILLYLQYNFNIDYNELIEDDTILDEYLPLIPKPIENKDAIIIGDYAFADVEVLNNELMDHIIDEINKIESSIAREVIQYTFDIYMEKEYDIDLIPDVIDYIDGYKYFDWDSGIDVYTFKRGILTFNKIK